MKKVGTITFHRADNYGAVLQAFALQKAILSLGYDTQIIDYDAREISKPYDVVDKRSCRSCIKSLLVYKERQSKKRLFDEFRKNKLLLSTPVKKDELVHTAKQYDKLITGSDQVWNYKLTASDGAYFLDFVEESHKKISYAASFGIAEIPNDKLPWYERNLADFTHISVREKTGAELVKNIIGRYAENDVDPVFLLQAMQWKKILPAIPTEKRFIFMYMCDEATTQLAKRFADENNMELVNLVYDKSILHPKLNVGNCRMDLSPEEFLSYIYHAALVVTGSFHATAFSIIFNKKFVVKVPDQVGSRITDLLDRTGLQERILTKDLDTEKDIDWDSVNAILDNARMASLHNLKESIES